MRYALIDIKEGEARGFNPKLHRTTPDKKMVVNENELMTLNENPEIAAQDMGTTLVSEQEMFNILKKINHG